MTDLLPNLSEVGYTELTPLLASAQCLQARPKMLTVVLGMIVHKLSTSFYSRPNYYFLAEIKDKPPYQILIEIIPRIY